MDGPPRPLKWKALIRVYIVKNYYLKFVPLSSEHFSVVSVSSSSEEDNSGSLLRELFFDLVALFGSSSGINIAFRLCAIV